MHSPPMFWNQPATDHSDAEVNRIMRLGDVTNKNQSTFRSTNYKHFNPQAVLDEYLKELDSKIAVKSILENSKLYGGFNPPRKKHAL
jgi:hypothetical protein